MLSRTSCTSETRGKTGRATFALAIFALSVAYSFRSIGRQRVRLNWHESSGHVVLLPFGGNAEGPMSILQDKAVLVTGAGAGIGRATAIAMAEVGATVAAADIDLAAARRTADQAAGNARRAIAIEADCGDVASINAMIARTVAGLGRLDVIVNNAGVTRYAQIMDLTEADWDRIHRVNAKGVFFCLQRAAREMISQGGGGRIINIASISGRGYPG